MIIPPMVSVQWTTLTADVFLTKMGQPRTLFRFFRSFQTNIIKIFYNRSM